MKGNDNEFFNVAGITPYANLNHYDLPLALENRYLGWLSRDVVYVNYNTP